MKENLLKFGIKVLVISTVLFVMWSLGGRDFYLYIIGSITNPLFKIFLPKVQPFSSPVWLNLLIPFLTLALATNTFSFKNRLYKTLLGIGVIIAWNSFLVFIWYFLVETVKHSDTVSIQQRFEFTALALTFLNGIFPFLLWIILFRENIKNLYYNKKSARTTP